MLVQVADSSVTAALQLKHKKPPRVLAHVLQTGLGVVEEDDGAK
jgi:hypothetical protein